MQQTSDFESQMESEEVEAKLNVPNNPLQAQILDQRFILSKKDQPDADHFQQQHASRLHFTVEAN